MSDEQGSDDDFSAQVRGGTLGGAGGAAALAVAAGVVPFFLSIEINGLHYAKLIGGGAAVALGLGSVVMGLYRLVVGRRGWGWLLGFVAMLLGAVHLLTSGVAGNLFGPTDEDAIAALREGGLESIEITDRSEDGFDFRFTGRRDGERCAGSIRIEGSSSFLSETCGLPIPDDELQGSCADGEVDACVRLSVRARDSEPVDWVAATRAAQTACDAGAERECFYVGAAYHSGDRGLEEDPAQAVVYFGRACTAGLSAACRNVGLMTLRGLGTERDPERACDLFERGCSDGHQASCESFGECFQRGDGRETDSGRARGLFEGACEADHAIACTNLGSVHLQSDPSDRDAALRAYRRGCELGSSVGCRVEAVLIADGVGDESPESAVQTLSELCEADDAFACLELGLRLHEGRQGIPVDQARALELFTRGCEASVSDRASCRNVGVYYRDRLGGTSDPSRARAYFQRACDAGLESACADARASR